MSIFITPYFAAYVLCVTFVTGLVAGSFLNCLAIRTLTGEPIARGRSHCPFCKHTLSALDLVPLFSFLFLGGKCRYCKTKISARYPVVEFLTAVLYTMILAKYGFSFRALELLILCSLLILVSLCDIDEYIIPDRFILTGIISKTVFVLLSGDITTALLGALYGAFSVSLPLLLLSLLLDRLLKKDTMGGGDIKLFFMAGMYFDWKINIFALMFSAILGILTGLLPVSKNEEKHIPFGPSISAAYAVCMFWGLSAVNWYLSFF